EETRSSAQRVVLPVGSFEERYFFGKIVEYLVQAAGSHPSYSSFLVRIPGKRLSKQVERADLVEIMIFACHPVHRNEMIYRKLTFQLLTEVDCSDYLVNKVERATEIIFLVSRGYR